MSSGPPPGARSAPAALRNRGAILDVLLRRFPSEGLALEIACGTGEHGIFFAPAMPDLIWQPTDASAAALESAAAWRSAAPAPNLRPPRWLDVTAGDWPVACADAIFCANLIHISPWTCAQGLMRGAGRTLSRGGILAIYGPFKVGGAHTAPSNADFDRSLRGRDPAWGVRDLEAVEAEGVSAGLALIEAVEMPANNKTLIFRRG